MPIESAGSINSAYSEVISGIEATLVAISGISHAIASPTGKPNPSYNELTIAMLLLAYSEAISLFVRLVLKDTLSFKSSFEINLSV